MVPGLVRFTCDKYRKEGVKRRTVRTKTPSCDASKEMVLRKRSNRKRRPETHLGSSVLIMDRAEGYERTRGRWKDNMV